MASKSDAHQYIVIVWMWFMILQCNLDFGGDVPNKLEWVGKLSYILLLNNKLLNRRPRRQVHENGRRLTHDRMRDIV